MRACTALAAALLLTLTASPALAVTGTPAGEIRGAGGADVVPGSYIAVLRDGAATRSGDVAALAARYGGTVAGEYRHALRGFSVKTSEDGARRLAADPAVAYVERNRIVRATGEPETSAAQPNPPWTLDRLDRRSPELDRTYQYMTTSDGTGVRAYVIDSGVRITHQDFGGRAEYGWDTIGHDPVADDCTGHGTHVAGTIAGTTYGVAKDVRVVAVRILSCEGHGTLDSFLQGIDWVADNAVRPAVVNASVGGTSSGAVRAAVRGLVARGIPFVAAAGNDNGDACAVSPANTAEAITVGSATAQNRKADSSNYGRCLDIFAHGVDVTSAGHETDTQAVVLSGTSMAAPHVTGVAARYLDDHPLATPDEVALALNRNASDVMQQPGLHSPLELLHASVGRQPDTDCTVNPAANNNVGIPDIGTAHSIIQISTCDGALFYGEVRVKMGILHPHPEHLRISLVTTGGDTVLLKNLGQPLSSGQMFTTPVEGAPRDGFWKLKVEDLHTGDVTGQIDHWNIEF
ncbi:S8 family serine peptidase [Sphaerisporangium sp. B11E5]|uniref:S8 family peptidase n=1 Tax=Sphaerisporangium sp. B11E5 TaxID=3153563 RepID=UPI00325DD0A6